MVEYGYGCNSFLGFLRYVDVVAVTIVLEINAVSIFRIEVCKVGEFWCICMGSCFQKTMGEGRESAC